MRATVGPFPGVSRVLRTASSVRRGDFPRGFSRADNRYVDPSGAHEAAVFPPVYLGPYNLVSRRGSGPPVLERLSGFGKSRGRIAGMRKQVARLAGIPELQQAAMVTNATIFEINGMLLAGWPGDPPDDVKAELKTVAMPAYEIPLALMDPNLTEADAEALTESAMATQQTLVDFERVVHARAQRDHKRRAAFWTLVGAGSVGAVWGVSAWVRRR